MGERANSKESKGFQKRHPQTICVSGPRSRWGAQALSFHAAAAYVGRRPDVTRSAPSRKSGGNQLRNRHRDSLFDGLAGFSHATTPIVWFTFGVHEMIRRADKSEVRINEL